MNKRIRAIYQGFIRASLCFFTLPKPCYFSAFLELHSSFNNKNLSKTLGISRLLLACLDRCQDRSSSAQISAFLSLHSRFDFPQPLQQPLSGLSKVPIKKRARPPGFFFLAARPPRLKGGQRLLVLISTYTAFHFSEISLYYLAKILHIYA